MSTLDHDIQELQNRLKEGSVQRAYRGIIAFMSRLRKTFADFRGESAVSGLYQGYFDMTYFALFPEGLKVRDLKLAVVFNYETFHFEAWLSARNRKVQRYYWEILNRAGYEQHPLVEPSVGIDAIVMAVLATSYSLEDEANLTVRIVEGVAAFERDLLRFLSQLDEK